MESRKRRNITILSNFAIGLMLVLLVTLTMSYNTKYAMVENKKKPIYQGNTASNKVSIMFNVYWGTEYIDGILDVLDRYDVKATFFVGGSWVEKNNDKLKQIYDKGHEIANHGYFHKNHEKLDYNGNYNEIEANNKLIEGIIGVRPTLFAPPSGAYSKLTMDAAESLQMRTIMWSKDIIDWRDKDSNIAFKRATDNIKGGDLILAHPTKHTLEALPKILELYKSKNLDEVTVSQNLQI